MKICLKERCERMRINEDHQAACWMNVKAGVEDGSIELVKPEQKSDDTVNEEKKGGETE